MKREGKERDTGMEGIGEDGLFKRQREWEGRRELEVGQEDRTREGRLWERRGG